ncbi:hypothetical protein B0H14DRAFT_3874404 [Mycena olivaceomarginata]|nr:hypothetical protein B0H14DRAFT_3874404 [Mycena olivaceomarginata]
MKAGISVLLAASEPTVRNSTSGSIQDRVPSTALEHLPNTADMRAPGTTVPIEDIDPSNLRIVLLDGEEFSFDSTQVPNPPNIHFSNDIPRLFKEWESSTLLRVNGRGIAIKDWPMFYQRRKQSRSHKSGAWDKIRTAWGNWKKSGKDSGAKTTFGASTREKTTRGLRYQQILDALKEARESQERSDAKDARRFFNGNLDHSDADGAFAYTKSGQRRIKEKDSAVAEIWRDLLVSNADIARRWAAIQQEDNRFT